jgi:predicted permease
MLTKSPLFSVVTILTLALGIGANTAIFSVVDATLLRPLPFRDDSRLVVLRQPQNYPPAQDLGFSDKEITDYRTLNHSFDTLVEYHTMSFILLGGRDAYRVQTGVVSWNFFRVLGIQPILGRDFRTSDEQPNAEDVLLLSYDFWKSKFAGDPNVVGRVLAMNNRPHMVVGVLPPFPLNYPNANDVYMPSTACPFRNSASFKANRAARMMTMLGRLKPDTKLETARADLETIDSGLHREYAKAYPKKAGIGIEAVSLREELARDARLTFLILMGTVGLVLLVACANVANLVHSRVLGRQRELAVRAALGASRGRLIRQLLTESTLLALAGGAFGVLLAALGRGLLAAFAARFTPLAAEVHLDGRVLLFTLVVSIVTGLIFGSLPAFGTVRRLAPSLQEGGRSATAGRRRHLARNVLFVTQVSFSVVLLAGAGLMLRSLVKMLEVNPGFRTENVLSARITLNFSKYINAKQRGEFYDQALARLRAIPGVLSAAIGSGVPLLPIQQPFYQGFRIQGRPVEPGQAPPVLDLTAVSSQYFESLGVPLVMGRTFTDADNAQAPPVGVINGQMAKYYWRGGNPIGQQVTMDGGKTWITIVGVVSNFRMYALNKAPGKELYLPLAQVPFGGRVVVRTAADPRAMEQTVRRTLASLDPDNPVDQMETLEKFRSESLAAPRQTTILLGLIMTAAGIFGVLGLSVVERTNEIGVRMALGADPAQISRLVLARGLGLVLLGIGLGAAAAAGLTRVLANLLYGVTTTDPATFLGVGLLLTVVALGACYLPARRAAHVDPIVALRQE